MTFKILSTLTILAGILLAPNIAVNAQISPNSNPYLFDNSQCNLSSGRCGETFGVLNTNCSIFEDCDQVSSFTPKTKTARPALDCNAYDNCQPEVGSISTNCPLFFETCESYQLFTPKTQTIRPSQIQDSPTTTDLDVGQISTDCDIFNNCPSTNTPDQSFVCTLFAFNCPIPTNCETPIFAQVDPCFQPYEYPTPSSQVVCYTDSYGIEIIADTQDQCEPNPEVTTEPTKCYSINQDLCEGVSETYTPDMTCDIPQGGIDYNQCDYQNIYDGFRPGLSNTPESFYIGENTEPTDKIFYNTEETA